MWNEIANEKDLYIFMDAMYGFHDSCLKEIKYISGAYVNEKLNMLPVNNQRILHMIIQRQFENPSVIEMQFEGLKYLKLFPNDENYTCEILDATMILKEDCVYCCNCCSWNISGWSSRSYYLQHSLGWLNRMCLWVRRGIYTGL